MTRLDDSWVAAEEERRAWVARHGLYRAEDEHSSCGVGLVVSIDGKASRKVVESGITALKAIWHRGAVDADGKTGDGAGIHVQIPVNFFYDQIRRIAPSSAPVFITGESGSGKELAAAAIHARSPRGPAPLIAINCAAIPRDLMESELFGVVRQVAGDTVGLVRGSLVTAQDPGRVVLAERLAQVRGVPAVEDLNALRALLMEEMVRSGRIARFDADITRPDGTSARETLVRIGVFNLIAGDRYLSYLPESGTILELSRQPQGRYRAMAAGLYGAAPNSTVAAAVDPGRGSLLALLIEEPSIRERIAQGGLVGYTILLLGFVGLLLALQRWVYLGSVGRGIHAQLKAVDPQPGNALGRILQAYHDNKDVDTDTLELKLDEAILREVPRLEKWQGGIKVIAAVAPLLGLLGTVVGMIATFQAITLFGTGDPKLMAGGISQALVTTVLGLAVAIPLVLLHSLVASRSKALVEILEEQSASIIARQAEAAR